MTAPNQDALLQSLENRFWKHMQRHAGMAWKQVLGRIESFLAGSASDGRCTSARLKG